jgi:Leucine-rich repeat (LRR) protein
MGNRIELTLSHNNLIGSIPIARRRALQEDETNSQFSFRLQKIDASYNQLTGTISPVAAFLPTLRYLDFSSNRLSGVFPGTVGWASLEYIAGANNRFSGKVASGYPSTLMHMDFRGNVLTGGIPQQLCFFPNLNFLDLSNNEQLNGTVPACLTDSFKLRHLDLANSNLEGTVASEFGELVELQVFNVSHNMLSSFIPTELAGCSDLKTLDLCHNEFFGTIPSEIGNIRFLKTLHLGENDLTGTLPKELGELTKLEDLTLAGNSVQGTIPSGLCDSQVNLTSANIGCTFQCSCCF